MATDTKLSHEEHTCLHFISQNEGEFLPAGDRLPPPVKNLEALGLVRSGGKIVDEIEGSGSEFNEISWFLTEKGRELLKSLGPV